MPRERSEFFRESSSIEKERIFVLAFEGNNTEEQYFAALKDSKKFNNDLIYLHLLTRKKSDTNSAPKHVFNKLKKEAKEEFNFADNDELWMIIDTDQWKNIPEIIGECEKLNNMYVAVSNPCFEFWLLLHIKDITEYSKEEQEKILANAKVSKNRTYIEKKIIEIIGSHNKSKLQSSKYLPYVNDAINRARGLSDSSEKFPTELGSDVFKIVEKLIKN